MQAAQNEAIIAFKAKVFSKRKNMVSDNSSNVLEPIKFVFFLSLFEK